MTMTITAAEFAGKCLALIDRVEKRGESFVITKRGRPFVLLEPVPSKVISQGTKLLPGKCTDKAGPAKNTERKHRAKR
jgi:antitoxin (DNA-binding transcriptional repressor) of toxin-antitoxin stability system